MTPAAAPPEDGVRALLAKGVSRGLITPEQAVGLAALARSDVQAPRDDERLRFITGFADIFVTIGIALFLGAGLWFADQALPPAGRGASTALLAWALAEFFTRRRRMALPSIVLLLAFAYGSLAAFAAAFGASVGHPLELLLAPVAAPLGLLSPKMEDGGALALACTGTVVLVGLHYWRFRVPITVAAGAAAIVGTGFSLLAVLAPEVVLAHRGALILGAGLALFVLAMRFDLADPAQVTRGTDIAFWLHLLAAPLIVHPLLSGLVRPDRPVEAGTATAVLGLFLALSVVAVVIDRRAVLVSGLLYAGIAFGSLAEQAGFAGSALPLTLLALGAFILLLSAGWQPLRWALLSLLPSAAVSRLPHPTGPR